MGKYQVILQPTGEKHLSLHKKSGNKLALNKIQIILEELSEHPFSGTGRPEALKHELSGFWSRRINAKDRLIYAVEESKVIVYVVSAIGHYRSK